MIETCCNCFAGRIIKFICDNCGHDYRRKANDNTPSRHKVVREKLPNLHEQRKLRKAVYVQTGADVFNTSIRS